MTEFTEEQREKVALKGMSNLFSLWKLEPEESANLLKMTEDEWSRVVAGTYDERLTGEQIMRVKFLIGIHSSLLTIYGTETCYNWVKLPNLGPKLGPIMKGRRPIDVMLGDDWFPMSQIRRYLQAEVLRVCFAVR